MTNSKNYPRASRYPDLETIYSQCSGPGGLKLAEFMAAKLDIQPGKRLLDVGFNRGYQSCFLAKEYGCFVVGIDPGLDRQDGRPHVEHLMDNARSWVVEDLLLGVQSGVPNTPSGRLRVRHTKCISPASFPWVLLLPDQPVQNQTPGHRNTVPLPARA